MSYAKVSADLINPHTICEDAEHRVLLIVLKYTNLLTLTILIDGLRAANDMRHQSLYSYRIVTVDGADTIASNHLSIPADGPLPFDDIPNHIVVISSWETDTHTTKDILRFLQLADNQGSHLYGVDQGVMILAEGGFLDHHRATTHWEVLPAAQLQYPKVKFEERVLISDRKRTTCPGHTSCLEMLVSFVTRTAGESLALAISREMIYTRLRYGEERQRLISLQDHGNNTSYLDHAIALMENTLDTPQKIIDIAKAVGVSVRQLENRYKQEFDCTPAAYYLRLRLAKSRQLLLYSTMLILNIAFSCGFTSHSTFSRSFRNAFGVTPNEYRKRFVLLSDRSYVSEQKPII